MRNKAEINTSRNLFAWLLPILAPQAKFPISFCSFFQPLIGRIDDDHGIHGGLVLLAGIFVVQRVDVIIVVTFQTRRGI